MWEMDHKEGWAPKNWRFWTVVLEKTRESPLDNKEIKPVNSKENQGLRVKLQYSGHLMWRVNLLEKTLMLAKIEGGRRRGQQRMRWLDGITDLLALVFSLSLVFSVLFCGPTTHRHWGWRTRVLLTPYNLDSARFPNASLLCPLCHFCLCLTYTCLDHFQPCLLLPKAQSPPSLASSV